MISDLTTYLLQVAQTLRQVPRQPLDRIAKAIWKIYERDAIELDGAGRVRRFVEKPAEWSGGNLANAGVYLCDPAILNLIPAGFSDFGHDIIPMLLQADAPVCGHLATGYLLDIGTPDAYAQAQHDWQDRFAPSFQQCYTSAARTT